MNWLKKWCEKHRAPARIVVEFRGNEDAKSTAVRVKAIGTEDAPEAVRRAMVAFILAIEKGAFQLSRENGPDGSPYGGMDALWQNALVLGWVILHENELK